VLVKAARQAPSAAIKRAIADLQSIVAAVEARAIPARLHVDLAEVRGFDYYTGVRFQGFVAGAAEPVLQGGRYDDLLARYGRPSPAVGFAIDVEAAAGALEVAALGAAESIDGDNRSALVVGDAAAAVARADALRAEGGRAAPLLIAMSAAETRAYASRWGYGRIVDAGRASGTSRRPAPGGRKSKHVSSKKERRKT
jgi:ATP phosphoribosyltransferase regulatory subunit